MWAVTATAAAQVEPLPDAEAEVVDLCRDLIRIDTTNFGRRHRAGGGGRPLSTSQSRLHEVGLDPERITCECRRARGAWWCGSRARTRSRGALLLHGHLDVVPAQAQDWSHPPFGGEVDDDRRAESGDAARST